MLKYALLKEELNEFVLRLEIILILLKLDSKLEQTIYFNY